MEFYFSIFFTFILIFVRVLSFLSASPVLGYSVIPFQLRFWVSIFLSYIFLLILDKNTSDFSVELFGFVILVLKEVMIGLILGFSAWVIFYSVQFAGHLIGFDIGFSTATAFDPEHSEPLPALSQFKNYLFVVIFLMLNGHHFLIQVLKSSFEIVPISSSFSISAGIVDFGIKLITFVFISAIKISAPVIVALFLTDLSIGILSRAFPQMNIFMFAFSIKIIVGLLALILTVPLFVYIFKKLFIVFQGNIIELLKIIGS